MLGRTLELDDLDGVVLLPHAEDLEVAERRLLGLGVSVDLNTKEVSLVVPVELALQEDKSKCANVSATTTRGWENNEGKKNARPRR